VTLAASKLGGLKLRTIATGGATQIGTAAEVSRYILTLRQHPDGAARPLVKVGEHVDAGQPIAEPVDDLSTWIHAPVSGTVIAIEPHAHPFFPDRPQPAIVIENDGLATRHVSCQPMSDYSAQPAEIVRDRILRGGICGLGGAMFPTAAKIYAAASASCRTLLLNGAECEPYICCDDALLRNRASDVVRGAQIILHAAQASKCVIALERDKTDALQALQRAVDEIDDKRISVRTVNVFYPAGGECQLIAELFSIEVPTRQMPSDIGILCHNVGTAAAIARLFTTGEPLISRVVTVTGNAAGEPRNLEVKLGTPMRALIGSLDTPVDKLIMGGAMMGMTLADADVPIIKGTNCIIAATLQELPQRPAELPCIRCGDCAEVCPSSLLPQQLYWYTRAEDRTALERFGLADCIECGCCDYVCPSHLRLASRFHAAKQRLPA
jgi:electron transport complex protein RnfC